MFILETLDALCRALAAGNSVEVERLLDVEVKDMSFVSHGAVCLRDLLIGEADDIHGVVIDIWDRVPFKTASECSCRIYEEFRIADDLPIEGKSIADLRDTYKKTDPDTEAAHPLGCRGFGLGIELNALPGGDNSEDT